jgi:hypothetical protein
MWIINNIRVEWVIVVKCQVSNFLATRQEEVAFLGEDDDVGFVLD